MLRKNAILMVSPAQRYRLLESYSEKNPAEGVLQNDKYGLLVTEKPFTSKWKKEM